MAAVWYYFKDEQQVGPFTSEQLRQLVATGELGAEDLIWKEGMADWVAATRVKGLFDIHSPRATVPAAGRAAVAVAEAPPAAQPTAQPIGYFSPSSGLSERTRRILHNFPPVTGPRDVWPLSDQQLAQLAATEKLRKKIRGFASLCRALLALTAILGVLILFGALLAMSEGRRGSSDVGAIMLLVALAMGGISVLYFFVARATMQCKIWGAIVMIVLGGMGIIINLANAVLLSSTRLVRTEMLLTPLISSLLGGAFIWAAITAITAIPKFLASPVWAQEALVNAKL